MEVEGKSKHITQEKMKCIEVRCATDSGHHLGIQLNALPDECPYCHRTITPDVIYGIASESKIGVLMLCPHKTCNESFVGHYTTQAGSQQYGMYLNRTSIGTTIGKSFPDAITNLSPSFVSIYNEAYGAEQYGLLQICGVGYRKALEFLIKDYAIKNNPNEKGTIESKALQSCIKDHVTNEDVKLVASRAVWLGNDETHFVRQWANKDLTDLKSLIDLTVHWMDAEALTKQLLTDMPVRSSAQDYKQIQSLK